MICGGPLPNQPHNRNSRPVVIRLLLAQICQQMTKTHLNDGFHDVGLVHSQLDRMKSSIVGEQPVTLKEVMEIFETEGNGYFILKPDTTGKTLVKYEANTPVGPSGPHLGEIGSPVIGQSRVL